MLQTVVTTHSHALDACPVVLLLSGDREVRLTLHPLLLAQGYQVMEAVDGLHGLDLLRQRRGTIAVILVDAQLPRGLDGYDTCLRIISLCQASEAPIPIIPFSTTAEDASFFAALGCGPMLLKPFTSQQLAAALCSLVTWQPTAPSEQTVLAHAHRKAAAAERAERLARAQVLRAAVYATSPAIRVALDHLLGAAGATVTAEAGTPQALAGLLTYIRPDLLVCDVDGRLAIAGVAANVNVPLLVVAISAHQRTILLRDTSLLTLPYSLVDASGEDAAACVAEVVQNIVRGERSLSLSTVAAGQARETIVPALIMQQLEPLRLTARQCELVWLEYQGWPTTAVAQHLMVNETTIQSYWKRIQRRTGYGRAAIKVWLRERLDTPEASLKLCEQQVGGSTQ